MDTLLNETLEHLRQRVRDNLVILFENDLAIQTILEEPLSLTRSVELAEMRSINQKIIKENKDALHIQVQIVCFLKEYSSQVQLNKLLEDVN